MTYCVSYIMDAGWLEVWDVSSSNRTIVKSHLVAWVPSVSEQLRRVFRHACALCHYMDPIKEVKTVPKQCVRCWKVELLPHTVSWDFVFTDICVSVSLAPGKDGIFRFISPSLARITSSFLFDWCGSPVLNVTPGTHIVTFGIFCFHLRCV